MQESRSCQAVGISLSCFCGLCLVTPYSHQPSLLHTTHQVSIFSSTEAEEQSPRRRPVWTSVLLLLGYNLSRLQETALVMEFLQGFSAGQLFGFAEAGQGSHMLIFSFYESKLFLYAFCSRLCPCSSYQLHIWLLVVFICDKWPLAKFKLKKISISVSRKSYVICSRSSGKNSTFYFCCFLITI